MDLLVVASMCTKSAELALQLLGTIDQYLRVVNLIDNDRSSTSRDTPLRLLAVIGDLTGLTSVLLNIRLKLFSSIVFSKRTDALVKATVTTLRSCTRRLKKLGNLILWLNDCRALSAKLSLPGKLAWALRGNSVIDGITGGLTQDRSKLTMMYTMFAARHTPAGILSDEEIIAHLADDLIIPDLASRLQDRDAGQPGYEAFLNHSLVYNKPPVYYLPPIPETNSLHPSNDTLSNYPESRVSHAAILKAPVEEPVLEED